METICEEPSIAAKDSHASEYCGTCIHGCTTHYNPLVAFVAFEPDFMSKYLALIHKWI